MALPLGYENSKEKRDMHIKRRELSFWDEISKLEDFDELVDYMQDVRNVLWNFENLIVAKTLNGESSGTIESRGDRCLSDNGPTKRWITFTIAFVELVLSKERSHDAALPAECGYIIGHDD
jgi:hypothetical protein